MERNFPWELAQSFTRGSDPGPEFYNDQGAEGVGKLRFLDKKLVNIADNKGYGQLNALLVPQM